MATRAREYRTRMGKLSMKRARPFKTTAIRAVILALIFGTGVFPLAGAQKAKPADQDFTLHETTTSSGSIGGGRTISSTNYFSRNAMKRTAPDGNDTIIRIDEGRIITINHRTKTYSSATIQELNQMLEKTTAEVAENKEQLEAMRKMMGQMMNSFTVTKIGSGEPIAGFKTEKYAVRGILEMEIWAAPELKVPELYYDALKMSVRPNPIFDARKMYDEFKKINGMTMKTVAVMKMMEMDIRTETVVTSVERTPIPASTFDIPAGYKQVPADLLK